MTIGKRKGKVTLDNNPLANEMLGGSGKELHENK